MKSEPKSGKASSKELKETKEEVVINAGFGEDQLTISEMENVTTVFRKFLWITFANDLTLQFLSLIFLCQSKTKVFNITFNLNIYIQPPQQVQVVKNETFH